MQTFTTPMMKQYQSIKKQYIDCLLLYRMGDFYELFLEDAAIGAQVLNITLTSRPKGKDGRIPMAGVPYHAVDSYLAKLVKSGYKVAICEQVSLPNKHGIIEREVVRIVTPGTVLDEKALNKKENNYIIALTIKDDTLAVSSADISTGEFLTTQLQSENIYQIMKDEIAKIHPAECILPEALYTNIRILKTLRSEQGLNIFCYQNWPQYANRAENILKKHFGIATLVPFAIENKKLCMETSAVLLGYIQHTQKATAKHIKKITYVGEDDYLTIDRSTILNLELFTTIREHDTRGTLLHVLDQTITAMGGRLLKQWVKKPLIDGERIKERHDSIEELILKSDKRLLIRELLKGISDTERLLSRLSVNLGNARDLVHLHTSLRTMSGARQLLSDLSSPILQTIRNNLSSDIDTVGEIIKKYINEEPPVELKEGGIIKHGVNPDLDTLRNTVKNSKDWIIRLEKKERERTGISSLKIRFNQVFGFYIEVSKANLHLIPENYMRKQTLVNGERFITPELKEHEEIILTAEERINTLEYSLFVEVLQNVLAYTESLQRAAQNIAVLDCLVNFVEISEKYNYVRPLINTSGEIRILQGRHPVVEKLLDGEQQFVPNDVSLDNTNQQLLLITGPNMAGKSVFVRQVALLVLLCQIGCFVPANSASISIVDRIFVRSGASDVITSGLSTFMVEMVETAHILHYATKDSLIIMDEIGRGTSTYDGISIAWAVAEYLVHNFATPPKTLFATHYHELQSLEKKYPQRIKNYHMSVADDKGEPIFLHTILPGGTSHSFGIAVAKLAGLPEAVIASATIMLRQLEERNEEEQKPDNKPTHALTYSQRDLIDHLIHKELQNIDIHQLTPLEALNKLAELKDKIKGFELQQAKFIDID